jgi:hypothetical protein
MTRVVRFQPSRWEELEQLAATLSQEGRSVSPSQLAAMLIERSLVEIAGSPTQTLSAPETPRTVYATALISDEYYSGLATAAACVDAEG